jgi:ATP/ADP translocase
MPALFWAFVASNTTTESAKRGYAMIATCTQVGTIFGPLFISNYSARFGLPVFFAISGLLNLLIPMIILYIHKSFRGVHGQFLFIIKGG